MPPAQTVQENSRVVGFDLDGVIIDHTDNKIALARSFGVALTPNQTHSEILPRHMERSDYLELQNQLYDGTGIALSAPLLRGARETLVMLRERAIPFVLISRRRNPEHAIALLTARGLWGDLFTPQNTFFVESPEAKNVVGVREGVTHFFDDERRVLRAMPDISSRFLVDSFHLFDDEAEFPRMHDWGMIQDVLIPKSA